MPTQAKITHELEPQVLALAGAGKSSRAIAAALGRKGVKISHVQVAAFVKKRRSAIQAEHAKEAVRAHLSKQLPADLEAFSARLDALEADLRKVEARLAKLAVGSDPWLAVMKVRVRMVEAYRRCVDTKLHYTGADAPEDTTVDGFAGFLALGFDAA